MDKGWIALDIDGTVTVGLKPIASVTASYLQKLQMNGWSIVFVTGRTFSFAKLALQNLAFPYHLAVQNGADLLSMPSEKVIEQHYLDKEALFRVENAYREREEDFLVYAGYEHGDFCYYRPKKFSRPYLEYFEKLMELSAEPWQALDSFDALKQPHFSLIKCLGPKETMLHVEIKLRQIPGLELSTIQDPLNAALHCLLVTANGANKGLVLNRLVKKQRGRIIAAGDDRNDLPMLKAADTRIVMATAPDEVKREADILAKPAAENGIIEALVEATGIR